MRRRRPLLRAAAVGGAGYVAGKRRAQPAPPQPGPALTPAEMEQLQSLAQLHDQGILTDQEFDQQKAKVLRS
jgi:putative oligomerization/nucleic acid binding protein